MGNDPEERRAKSRPPTTNTTVSYGGQSTHAFGESLDWSRTGGRILVETIAAVNRVGDAISFAAGAHGRWLSTTVLDNEGRHTDRYETMEQAEQALLAIQDVARRKLALRQ
jgi:hypothetical protein